MSTDNRSRFLSALDECTVRLSEYLKERDTAPRFHPQDLRNAATLYVEAGGKRLRPALVRWSCGAVGGAPDSSLPASAAVELFHTWSLVHDDIIDRDNTRRGSDTVHHHFFKVARDRYTQMSHSDQHHYGASVAILTGDVQHGWAISMMVELALKNGLDANLTLKLIDELDTNVLNGLLEGEILDLQFSHTPLQELNVDQIEDMLWKKTGILYQYCARCGAMIGLETFDLENSYISALSEFSKGAGIAFQLQDDILGIVGDPMKLGKPVGSDIIEGKRTTVIHYAYENADPSERTRIEETLGKAEASEQEINEVVAILKNRGGIDKTRERAMHWINFAVPQLDVLPESEYRDLLLSWAQFTVDRFK